MFVIRNPGVALDFFKYERTLQLIRSASFPKNPVTCDEISNAFQNENIMNSIGRSQHVAKEAFFNGVVQSEEYSFCVFSSKNIMNMIEKHIDVNRRHYLLDATFKVVPVGPFNQFLIFYINYIEKVKFSCSFFRSLNELFLTYELFQAYPFIFVLMSRKTEECYAHVLRYIEENVFALLPSKVTTDYEIAMRNALEKQYPQAKFVKCWFHFTQAVKRNAAKVTGFINFIRVNDNAENIYYKLMSLPLLPASYIKPTFERLKSAAFAIDKRKFVRFINYYERQWIMKVSSNQFSIYWITYSNTFDSFECRKDHPTYQFLEKIFVPLVP